MISLKSYFLGLFPVEYINKDTLPDSGGNGIFNRFMSVLMTELDNNTVPKVEGFVESVVADTETYHKIRAEGFGNTLVLWDQAIGTEEYTKRLQNMWFKLNRAKGTKKAFKLLFNNLLDIDFVIEEIPGSSSLYDVAIYDTSSYDTPCNYLFRYRLYLTDTNTNWAFLSGPTLDPSDPVLIQLVRIINYLQPVNARLEELIINSNAQPFTSSFSSSFNLSFS